jgi:sugar lactone lactonase YvrE
MLVPTGLFTRSDVLGQFDQVFNLSDRTITNLGGVATLTLFENGRMSVQSSSGTLEIHDQWAAFKEDDIGLSFEVRMSALSGALTSGTLGTWIGIEEEVVWTLDAGAAGAAFEGTLELRSTINGTAGATIASATISFLVGEGGWDLSTAVYDSISFSLGGATVEGVFLSPDGTKMFVNKSPTIHSYDLSTPGDPSTAVATGTTLSCAAQDGSTQGFFIDATGTILYVCGDTTNTIYQYTLPTPWSLTGASYASKSFSVAGQDTIPQGIFVRPDGAKWYLAGSSSDAIKQYSMTAGDISTSVYDAISFSIAGQDTSIQGIFFKPDGAKMYIIGLSTDSIYQYTLATGWNLSTASYDSVLFSVNAQDTNPVGFYINSDGTKIYIAGDSNDRVYRYSMSS